MICNVNSVSCTETILDKIIMIIDQWSMIINHHILSQLISNKEHQTPTAQCIYRCIVISCYQNALQIIAWTWDVKWLMVFGIFNETNVKQKVILNYTLIKVPWCFAFRITMETSLTESVFKQNMPSSMDALQGLSSYDPNYSHTIRHQQTEHGKLENKRRKKATVI